MGVTGLDQAMMALRAMRGRSVEERRALWKLAVKMAQKDRGAVGEFTAPRKARVGEGAGE